MKKKYLKPVVEVYEMQLQCALLAASGEPNEDENFDFPEDENPFDGPLG